VDHSLLNQLEVGYLEDNSNNHHKIPRVVAVSLVVREHQEVAVSLVAREQQEVVAFSVEVQVLISLHHLA